MSFLSSFVGADASKNAGKAFGKQGALIDANSDVARQQLALADQYQSQYMSPMIQQAYNAANNYDPYAAANFAPEHLAYADQVGQEYDNAADQTYADYASRGLGSGGSGLTAEYGMNRRAQAADIANYRRQLMMRNAQERQRRIESFVPMISGITSNLTNTGAGINQNNIGALGGVGAMYQSSANQAFGNLASIASSAASLPGLGRRPTADAGNNSLGTNQPPAPPPMLGQSPVTTGVTYGGGPPPSPVTGGYGFPATTGVQNPFNRNFLAG